MAKPGLSEGAILREKRQHQRAQFVVPVEIKMADRHVSAQSEDLSLGGMFLHGESTPPIGTEVRLKLMLPKLGEVELPGFVRWTKDGGFGVQFGLLGARETHAIGKIVREAPKETSVEEA